MWWMAEPSVNLRAVKLPFRQIIGSELFVKFHDKLYDIQRVGSEGFNHTQFAGNFGLVHAKLFSDHFFKTLTEFVRLIVFVDSNLIRKANKP